MMVNDLERRAPTTGTDRPRTLPDGTDVEVWCRSIDTWVRGFAVIDSTPDGCRVLRHSDGSVLPALFPLQDVRRSH